MGLGSSWGSVIDVLSEIIPVYDKVNNAISLGSAESNRVRGISGRVRAGDVVLDAGSGFGNMSSTALALCGNDITLTLHDALVPMLLATKKRFDTMPACTCGVFENLPFRDSQFDVVMCGYSLRDAISLRTAISEIHRVLCDGGRLVIVDLGKPDGAFVRAGVTFYLRAVLPIIAFAIGGRRGLKFGALYGTYKKWLRNSDLESLLLEKFTRVEFETGLLGGSIMVAAYK